MRQPAAALPTASSDSGPPDLQRLYQEHAGYLRTLLARLLGPWGDPDDVTQEVFVIAWRKLPRLRPGDLRPWLTSIAVKRASEARRRSWLRRFLFLDRTSELIDRRTPERVAEANEADRIVYAALDQLSERKRLVFILYEIQGMSGEEIAEALDCPLKTVWTRLYYARREFAALAEPALHAPPERRR